MLSVNRANQSNITCCDCKALSGEKGVFIEITQGVGYIPTSPGVSTKRSS
jgi:hypothetical protein